MTHLGWPGAGETSKAAWVVGDGMVGMGKETPQLSRFNYNRCLTYSIFWVGRVFLVILFVLAQL